MKNKTKYKYWGFISYSHQDKKISLKLHKKLETLSLPKKKGIPKKLYPIFRDDEQMSTAPNLLEELKKELNDSKYLIVICTSNSKNSIYTNKEIEYFINQGKGNKIIAIIHQSNTLSIENVMPKSLKELYLNNKLNYIVDMNKLSFDKVSQIIAASILEIDNNKFMRFQFIRKVKIGVASTISLIVLSFCIIFFPTILLYVSPSLYSEMIHRYKPPIVNQTQAKDISKEMVSITIQTYNNNSLDIADKVLNKYDQGGLVDISISEIYTAISFLDGVLDTSENIQDKEVLKKRKRLELLLNKIKNNQL